MSDTAVTSTPRLLSWPTASPRLQMALRVVALALLAWVPILLSYGIVVVPSGTAGVLVSQTSGTLPGTLYPGAHFVTPLADNVVLFDTRDQLFTTGELENSDKEAKQAGAEQERRNAPQSRTHVAGILTRSETAYWDRETVIVPMSRVAPSA